MSKTSYTVTKIPIIATRSHLITKEESLKMGYQEDLIDRVLEGLPTEFGRSLIFDKEDTIVKRGRPRRHAMTEEETLNKSVNRDRKKHVASDPITNLIRTGASQSEVFDAILIEMANEVASLGFDKTIAASKGRDTVAYASKRISALKGLAEGWTKRMESNSQGKIDLSSKPIQRLYEFFAKKIITTCQELGYTEDETKVFVARLSEVMENWEEEAKRYISSD